MHIIPPFSSSSDPGYKFLRVFAEYNMERETLTTLYVEGGVSPYDWEVSSELFTLTNAQTVGQTNTIEASADAVLDKEETVTVTDADGHTVEIIVCVCDTPCCAGTPDAFEFDDDSTSDGVDDGDSITLYTTGGCLPVTWEITAGSGFSLDSATTYSHENTLSADGPDCSCTIKATDACGSEVEFSIYGYSAELAFDDDSTPDTITKGTGEYIYFTNGQGPYDWVVEGTGYSLDAAQTSDPENILRLVDGSCGVDYDAFCIITVTDACGSVSITQIRAVGGDFSDWYVVAEIWYDQLCGGGQPQVGDCTVSSTYTTGMSDQCFCPAYWHRYRRRLGKVMSCSSSPPPDCCDFDLPSYPCGEDNSNPPYVFMCNQYLTYYNADCECTFITPSWVTTCSIEIEQAVWEC